MKSHFELFQTVACPSETAFAFLADLTGLPQWNYNVLEVIKITEGSPQLGAVFRRRRPRDSFDYKIVDFKTNRSVRIDLLPPGPPQRYGFEVETDGAGTRLRYAWEIDLSEYKTMKLLPSGGLKNLLLRFADRHIQKKIRPATESNFTKLKAVLENIHKT